MANLVRQLMSKTWAPLHVGRISLEYGQYPGVYLLAYSSKKLNGTKIKLADIFYVGMSCSLGGVKSRLLQFQRGIEYGKSHSAAIRFFKVHAGSVPYSQLKRRNEFFVASISIPCKVGKANRTPEDLRKMGMIAKLEYDVLAHIKAKREREPWLNKK